MNNQLTDEALREFEISQAEQAFVVIQKQHNILHSVLPLIIASLIATIAAAVEFHAYILILFGAIFPVLIFFYVYRIRKMSLPAFLTAISVEHKYGGALSNRLASYYLSYVYDKSYYEELLRISALSTLEEKIDAMDRIYFYKNFGRTANFLFLIPAFAMIQVLIGIFLLFYDKALENIDKVKDFASTSIPVFNFEKVPLTEPVTLLTDLVIAFACIIFCCYFLLYMKSRAQLVRLFLFFFLLGLATFLGGLSHGFRYFEISEFLGYSGWIVSSVALLFLEYFFKESLSKKKNLDRFLTFLIPVKFGLVVILTVLLKSFIPTLINFSLVMICYILPVVAWEYTGRKERGLFLIILGISMNIITLFVFLLKFKFSNWVNYNDISHIILLISLSLLFSGLLINSQQKYIKKELI
jgi:hypothetical protein